MKKDEFVFRIGQKLFSIDDLDYIDDILVAEIRDWEASVRRGWVEVFQRRPSDSREWENPMSLGKFHLAAIKQKFT